MRKIPSFLFVLFLLFGLSVASTPARAEGDFAKPSLANFVKTLVRFGAVDIRREKVLDAYSRVVECDIYKKFYTDDFKWKEIRAAVKRSIKQDIGSFPTGYAFDATLQLGRYDFKQGLYKFTPRTAQTSSNVFKVLAQSEEQCTGDRITFPPLIYKFVLDEPIKMEGIPLTEKDGELLLDRLREAKNTDRLIYARINLRVQYIAPLDMATLKDPLGAFKGEKKLGPMVSQSVWDGQVYMDSKVESIEYYEDEARTKLIFNYVP